MTMLDRRMKFLDTNNPQKPDKCVSMKKFRKEYCPMIQDSDRYSNNLKLRLDPRLSMAFKNIRHPTIPQLHKEDVFENEADIQRMYAMKRGVLYLKTRPVTLYKQK